MDSVVRSFDDGIDGDINWFGRPWFRRRVDGVDRFGRPWFRRRD